SPTPYATTSTESVKLGRISSVVVSRVVTNPIGASGMIRFAEAALQVRGQAGEHQVDGARRVLGHAYGGGSQFFSMWLVGSAPPHS
ncbi:thiolase C-terminal domain-containing protein, partial [Streptomyces sp. NPDC000851]